MTVQMGISGNIRRSCMRKCIQIVQSSQTCKLQNEEIFYKLCCPTNVLMSISIRKGLTGRIPSLTLFNSGSSSKNEEPIEERLKPDQFSLLKTVRHGFPYKPTCLAYDPLQKLLAIGTAKGCISFYGQPGVQCNVCHEGKVSVQKLVFMVNEGALLSVCSDDSIHLWNLRHRKPAIVHSLHFNYKRDSISSICLSFQSKWIYLGTKAGNVHIVNIESFQLSGYIIHWNKAIEKSQKEHPGPIYHISENPQDPNKLLLGFESGLIVLWDLKTRVVDLRFYSPQKSLRSVAWYSDGKQFVSSHQDGTLSLWNIKNPGKPLEQFTPHGQGKSKGNGSESVVCSPINKVSLVRESCFLFSGGLHYGNNCKGLTIMEGKTKKLLLTKLVVDFECITSTPWQCDKEDALGIIVLLPKELIVYDLSSSSVSHMSTFDIPYEFSLHESPVTFTDYYGHCPASLMEDLYAIGSKQRKDNSDNWPISGGTLGDSVSSSFNDLIVTGHADGSLKFWDGSSGMFALMAKCSINKYFHKKRKASRTDSSSSKDSMVDDVSDEDFDFLAIHMVQLCVHSRTLAVVNAANHVLFFTYSNSERSLELLMLPIDITTEKVPEQDQATIETGEEAVEGNATSHENTEDAEDTVECEGPPHPPSSQAVTELWRPKLGVGKRPPGFQAQLCCACEITGDFVPLCYLSMSSAFGILAFGSVNFLVLVDIVQNKLINTFYPPDLTVSKIPSTPNTPNTPRTPQGAQSDSESSGKTKKSFNGPLAHRRITRRGSKPLGAVAETEATTYEAPQSTSVTDGPSENILCLTCAYTFTKKAEYLFGPCMWIGTSLGNVVLFAASFPPAGDQRLTQPILTFNTGLVFQHKGAIDSISILDKDGHLLSSPSYFWSSLGVPDTTCTAVSSNARSEERHFLVVCTEREAEVHCLPSHARFSKRDLSDMKTVLRSDVISIEGNSCLVCLCDSGHLLAFSLPSLSPLLDVQWDFPSLRGQSLNTFKFGTDGQALYLHSPTELQLLSIFTKTGLNFPDFSGTLFSVVPIPEKRNRGFFATLLSLRPSELDRERLFGDESGKGSKAIATRIPGKGTEDIQARAGGVGELMAKNMESLKERGEKLESLENKTQQMRDQSEQYAQNVHALTQKLKEKKWYQI